MELILLALFVCLTAPFTIAGKDRNCLEVIHQWNLLQYGFPTAGDREQAVANGNLVPSSGIPIDVQPHYSSNDRNRIFVTIPRFQTGIPYTLATVSESEGARHTRNDPTLKAYPSYDFHNSHGSDCDQITSAFRVAITECNQMWVIDSGVIGAVQHCAPQLLLFDLNTDQMIHRYRFDTSVYVPVASLLITPIVDVRDPAPAGSCQRAMIYIADVTHHGLIVYDYEQNAAWRIENKFMYPDPDFGTHTIAGESFTLMDGIFGLSNDKQNLYFHPLASISEYAVPLNILNNRTIWESGTDAMASRFRALGTRSSECPAQAIDSRKNIYCVTMNPIKLISWNVATLYKQRHLREIPSNPELIEFVSGMKVVRNSAGVDELWMMSNRFQKISAGTQNPDEVNFRVVKRSLDDVQNSGTQPDLSNKLVFSS